MTPPGLRCDTPEESWARQIYAPVAGLESPMRTAI
ncbi:MAG: hypothetical protein JWQ46_205 [Phenylobacterium sp.]|nr:hypothetical protein [Phenylobacterium sp.]